MAIAPKFNYYYIYSFPQFLFNDIAIERKEYMFIVLLSN